MKAVLGSIVVATMLVGPAQSPAGADPQGAKILFGAFPGPRGSQSPQQAVQALEAQIGRPLAGVRVFDLWDSPFPDPYTTWLRDTGHTVFLSVRSKRVNGSVILWRDIANAQPGSALYNQIVGWATNVKAFGAPMYFIFNHEPEAAASASNGTAQEFIAAWRKVITIFREQGVTNAKYVWTMTDYAFWRTDGGRADLWYPGDAYVDAIASDSYNWSNCRPGINTAWHTLEWIAAHMRDFGLAHPDEQLMLMEWASHDPTATPGRKATWINEAEALFKQPGWEQFTTVLYYHNTLKASCTFWADSSASSIAAFAAMANDPFYGRTTEGGGGAPDTSPPTAPGRPTGQSNAPGAISLTWPASSDDVATTLLYSIYRDGGSVPIGTVSSSSTTTVSFTDSGLVGGSVHTYIVTASDGQNTSPPSAPSDPITVQQTSSAIFQDGFDSGLGLWTTVSGLTLDQGAGQPAPSARVQTNASRAWASEVLSGTYPMACASAQVNLTSTVDGGSLIRLRTTGDGAIIRVAISSGRVLQLRNDVSGTLASTGVVLPTGIWTGLELCGSTGSSGSWTLYENGAPIFGPWAADTGSATIGRITIGSPDARTMTVNFDNVVVDQQAG